jgi:exopolysaccharide production protein ExoZ
MTGHQNKLTWVQALRGIAAFMVVMVHSRSVLEGSATGKFLADHVMFPLGMGVDLFFIISGFLMVWTTRDFDGSATYAWHFVAKRIARIWPLFAIVTPIALVTEHGLHGLLEPAVLFPYLEGLAFIPHDPRASGIYFHMAVGVAWTLCFECYFYAVFAACMLFGRSRYAAVALWFALTLIVIPLARGGFSLNVAAQPLVTWSRYANLAINPIVWDFVIGMLGGWLYGTGFSVARPWIIHALVIGSLTLLLTGWHRLGMVNFFGPHGWGVPLAILFLAAVMLAKIGAIRVPAWSVWMGNLSYSLYLIHVSVFEILQRIVSATPISHGVSNMLLFVLRPVVAVLGAWAMFHYIEAPVSGWARRRLLGIRFTPRQMVRSSGGGTADETPACDATARLLPSFRGKRCGR